ncbi:MAG: EAL domain-containing protein, partial [Pseudomonadota bacterium]
MQRVSMANGQERGTATEQEIAELRRIIDGGLVRSLYQPIVDARTCAILGYEALSRGPSGSVLESAGDLFSVAAQCELSAALDRECLRASIRGFAAAGALGRLFVNLTPAGLFDTGHDLVDLERLLE